jgi:hypothetical protein
MPRESITYFRSTKEIQMSHNDIHMPEAQGGMKPHTAKPGCYTLMASERGEVVMGWPQGVKPGLRNPFFDKGRTCGAALTEALWKEHSRLTTGCRGCARGREP